MATLAEWQTTYRTLYDKYTEALATIGPKVTLPGGVVVDKQGYLKDLLDQMKAIADMVPGVSPESHPVFEVTSIAR